MYMYIVHVCTVMIREPPQYTCAYIVHVHVCVCFPASQLIQILLKKFCVTDNPKKFSLYEEYGGDCE